MHFCQRILDTGIDHNIESAAPATIQLPLHNSDKLLARLAFAAAVEAGVAVDADAHHAGQSRASPRASRCRHRK